MFTQVRNTISHLRGHINSSLSISHTRREWLPPCCNGLIWRLELCGLTNVLSADAMWDRVTGSGRSIVEINTGRQELRLHQALKDHQRWRGRQDSLHGRRVQNAQCFTDLIVCLPEDVWREDLNRTGGEYIKAMMNDLRWHHQEAFKQDLTARQPRYLVCLETDLAQDRIKFLFGNGIYLPTVNDAPMLHVLLTLDNTPIAAPMWNLLQDNFLPLGQPTGFYADQECLLFTPEGQGPLSVQGWHSSTTAYLLVRQIGDNNWLASSDNAGRAKAWMRDGIWCFERRPINEVDGQVLSLKLVPAASNKSNTIIFERFKYVLQFEALALPQLSLVPGLSKWALWLNASGVLATAEQMQHEFNNLINLSFDDSGLQLGLPGELPQLLGKKITASISIGNTGASLLPMDLSGRIGLLQFSQPTSYILDQETQMLGRTDPQDTTSNPDIALDKQLAQPGALLWKTNAAHLGSTMASLGLSRKHATLRVQNGQLILEPVKESCLLQPLTSNENQIIINNKVLHLEPGESVLIGNCVLRFRVESE